MVGVPEEISVHQAGGFHKQNAREQAVEPFLQAVVKLHRARLFRDLGYAGGDRGIHEGPPHGVAGFLEPWPAQRIAEEVVDGGGLSGLLVVPAARPSAGWNASCAKDSAMGGEQKKMRQIVVSRR